MIFKCPKCDGVAVIRECRKHFYCINCKNCMELIEVTKTKIKFRTVIGEIR